MKLHIIGIDLQNDFCQPDGKLSVPKALDAAINVANMIKRLENKIDDIHLTQDSHHEVHVAHPIYWKDSKGNHPNPFTIITSQEIKDGKWTTTKPYLFKKAFEYVETLEKNGRYPLCIWPPHCLIGSPGHNIVPEVWEAVHNWEVNQFASVNYVTKGSNHHTEHYSAIQADVPDPDDPTTQINTDFLNMLLEADIIAATGIAGSHCLANTMRDIVKYFNNPDFVKKIVFLEDATAPVPGFEHLQDQFVKDLTKEGMQVSNTKDFLV